jgi:hypothetical protein
VSSAPPPTIVDVTTTPPDLPIRGLIAGDTTAIELVLAQAVTGSQPTVLVAAALVVPGWRELLDRALTAADSDRDRQLVGGAAAHPQGGAHFALLLARDHLAAHPDSLLAAHIAAASTRR